MIIIRAVQIVLISYILFIDRTASYIVVVRRFS